MIGTVKKILIGASVVASMSAIASTPASAGTLAGATIGGTNPGDYLVYDSDGTNTFLVPNTQANVQKVLDGNAAHPTGNVELAASSEQTGFNFNKYTSLSGTIGGKSITLSSLTASDWSPTFVSKWLGEAATANGLSLGSSDISFVSNIFIGYGGEQRFSDPNISYVNQNDTTGEISIGLAGHFNAVTLLTKSINAYAADTKNSLTNRIAASGLATLLSGKTIQASELVKVSYDGGPDQILYSFKATDSGLVNGKGLGADGISHSGNYEVKIPGVPPTTTKSVPEPSAILGLMAVGGMLVASRKLTKTA